MSNPFDPFSFASKTLNTTVGFDEVFKRLNELGTTIKIPTYPPYNIRKVDETKYVIELAVAGFGKHDIEVEMADGILTIKGETKTDEATEYLYKGIADRAFTRNFTLADSVEIKNAELINGMLKVWLERFIPEEKKPKKYDVKDGTEAESSTKQFLNEKYTDK